MATAGAPLTCVRAFYHAKREDNADNVSARIAEARRCANGEFCAIAMNEQRVTGLTMPCAADDLRDQSLRRAALPLITLIFLSGRPVVSASDQPVGASRLWDHKGHARLVSVANDRILN